MPDLLYEIGAEEIPASYIAPALAQVREGLEKELKEARLTHGAIRTAATPRHLVLHVAEIAERQPDAEQEMMGPSVKAAFDAQGNPTKALMGFAKGQGVDPAQVQRIQTPRGEYVAVRKQLKGRPAIDILAEVLPRITMAIGFPKSMVWLPERKTFARPVRWLVALFGAQVVPFEIFEVRTDRFTEGHPILSPGRIEMRDAGFETYKRALRERFVVIDETERKAFIRSEIEKCLQKFGGKFREEKLLDEVTQLVQHPCVTVGSFDPVFLDVPAPVVEAAMMEHQRYFPVRDAQGRLQPHFIFVSDRTKDTEDLIRLGNEQVLKARLADAQFFDQVDRKTRLEERVPGLKGVAFLKGLGTYYDKTLRLEKLAAVVSGALGLDAVTAQYAVRAAHLCKADLLTEMVGEFPALQGEVGHLYALRDGEPRDVAEAIEEHYLPRSAESELPATAAGRALGLTEKFDNMTGCFALGLLPTGSQDPYALRRQAAGALRMIEESGRHINLSEIVRAALALLPEPHSRNAQAVAKLLDFVRDRLFQMALDRGYPHDLINAALNAGFEDVTDFWMRMKALKQLSGEAVWQDLVISVERTFNISKAAPKEGKAEAAHLSEPQEKDVWALYQKHGAEIESLLAERKYADASRRYVQVFAAPLHEFFEKVFVNVDDMNVRNNRLRLMREINRLFSARVADLSQITTGVQK